VPEISVLLPYRDAAPTLAEAVDSVLGQVGVDLELIAIDDASRDDGPRWVAAAAARDRRLVLARSGGHGVARALAVGLAAARGAWIARMDADDVSHPDRLRRTLALLASDDRLGAAGTRVRAIGGGPGLARYVAWQNALVTAADHARDLFVESPLCHPSVVLRRRALDDVGPWRAFDGPEDYELWLRLAAAGWGLAKVPDVLLDWRHHEGRVTFTDPRCAPPRLLATKAPFVAAAIRARGRPLVVWGAGPTGKRLARALEPEGLFPEAFVDIDPKKQRRRARGAPIWAPDALPPGRYTVAVAVGAAGARDEIRAWYAARGGDVDELVCCA
jgi:glycosyltransferase involved in cell wall biosynthesis